MFYKTTRFFPLAIFIFAFFCWRCSLIASAQKLVTHPDEVRALGAIKGKLDDSLLRNLSNWNKGDPCVSNWTGVLCYNSTMDDGYLHVVELQLLQMQLSGTMSPELGKLTLMKRLNLMWNSISGRIPNEIGNITSLELLLLNGNQITGSLPEEIGFLPVLDRIQIDQNFISGPLPTSFSNLLRTRHFHMNNNSISGQIPPELSKLPRLVHLLIDNNKLSGYLPPELSELPNLRIIQLDNNNFSGTTIPSSYSNMTKLLKMSLRNCYLEGPVPDMSGLPTLGYIDLSSNKLSGSIPDVKLSDNITTIDLSNNELTGTIPRSFSGLPNLQILSLANNSLNGSIPASVFQGWKFNGSELTLDLQNNQLSGISGGLNLPLNITLWLQGNPICSDTNLTQFCKSRFQDENDVQQPNNSVSVCPARCPPPYEYPPDSPISCFCAAPLIVEYRLKSPGFWDFIPYLDRFEAYMTSGLSLLMYQLDVFSFQWQEGPRLAMELKFFPTYDPNATDSNVFNKSEVERIKSMFTMWEIADSDVFGPYELLGFNLSDLYKDGTLEPSESRLSSLQVIGIVTGAVITAVVLTAVVSVFVLRKRFRRTDALGRRRFFSKLSIKIDGIKEFKHEELRLATNGFHQSAEVGQGGYGKVYRGILSDGVVVAIKCAQEGSLQGEKEFFTEIELLSRLHHRNLVSLIGFCVEEGQQMLVYEFMSNGTLRDLLSAKSGKYPTFAMRLRIALASAKGILYLHTEANPPIFHRDIKATNILLDSNFTAKVADFGLSRLAPIAEIEGTAPAYVSTVVKGTPGYLDPEYFLTHKLTDKSDVYSLGVVFLELMTGRPPIWRGKNIVRDVNVAYKAGEMLRVIDEHIGSYPLECADKMFQLALKCCQEETDLRPAMKEVVRTLEDLARMIPDSDEDLEAGGGEPGKTMMTPLFSSTTHRTTSSSGEFSGGSALISGAVPMIAPR